MAVIRKLKFKAESVHSPPLRYPAETSKSVNCAGVGTGADILILNDPIAGVDIETKQEIYGLLREAKTAGRL